MDMNKMIFITGFARGGTSWLRDCIASHPSIKKVPGEMVIFKEYERGRDFIERKVEEAILKKEIDSEYFVNKAPANAPYIGKVSKLFPESKFLFIIRDPRDVFISHKRGNQEWMRGANSTVDGCLRKTQIYYEGFLEAADQPNVMLVKYEDLHQDFHATLRKVFQFIGVRDDRNIINQCYKDNNFVSIAGRHKENRDAAARKGVIGDWVNFLESDEEEWIKDNAFWSSFMEKYNYEWKKITLDSIFKAMKEGGVHDLSEDDFLNLYLNPDKPNLLLLHDIDLLRTKAARKSVLETAELEGKYGLASIYNFLPLDDMRYSTLDPSEIIDFINQIKSLAPKAAIGLHLNATEKFFPIDMEEVDENHPNVKKALEYLHFQIDEYEKHGIRFRTATAHGYGRRSKEPNNASRVFREELLKRGVRMFDNDLRPKIQEKASKESRIHDVGGAITMKRMQNNGPIDDPETYRRFLPKSLINFLLHPGNYDVNRPLTLGVRLNIN